jgi:hypothetical protein
MKKIHEISWVEVWLTAPAIVNAWPVEFWDDCEHNQLQKHNGQLLWSQQPNKKMSLIICPNFRPNEWLVIRAND